MKFIHCADIHLDSKMQTHLTIELSKERKNEILLTFERLIKYAKDNGVSVIVIAGDMFDTSKTTSITRNKVVKLIENNPNITFILLTGNHDEDNFIISLPSIPSNLIYFTNKWSSYQIENVVFTGAVFTSDNIVSIYDTLSLDKDKVNVVVLHGQISKYSVKNNPEIIDLTKLENKNIDYLALGHIHSYQKEKLDSRGEYCYSGCLEGRGFDECGEKGFVLCEVLGDKVTSNFIPFAKRCLHEVEIDVTGITEWFSIEEKILSTLSSYSKNDLIKVVLIGKFTLDLQKFISVTQTKLKEDFYFAKIVDKSSLQLNSSDYVNDISLKGEFIRTVLASNLTKEEQERVILVGLKALSGEEV